MPSYLLNTNDILPVDTDFFLEYINEHMKEIILDLLRNTRTRSDMSFFETEKRLMGMHFNTYMYRVRREIKFLYCDNCNKPYLYIYPKNLYDSERYQIDRHPNVTNFVCRERGCGKLTLGIYAVNLPLTNKVTKRKNMFKSVRPTRHASPFFLTVEQIRNDCRFSEIYEKIENSSKQTFVEVKLLISAKKY